MGQKPRGSSRRRGLQLEAYFRMASFNEDSDGGTAEAPAESDNARGAVAHCKWIPAAVWGQLYATFTEKTSRGAPAAVPFCVSVVSSAGRRGGGGRDGRCCTCGCPCCCCRLALQLQARLDGVEGEGARL